jgi:hypothetical protein
MKSQTHESILNVFKHFSPHITEGTHHIGDEDYALTYMTRKLPLSMAMYKSNTQEAYDNLEPVDQLCDRIKFLSASIEASKRIFFRII